MRPRIKNKSELSFGKFINHPGSVHTTFYCRNRLIQSIIKIVKNNKRRGGDGGLKKRGLIKFLSLKRRGLLVRGRLFERGAGGGGVLMENSRYKIV